QQAARLMVVGQAPSGADAQSNIPFTGEAGSRLFDWLKRAGWDDEESFRQTAYITSVTKCFPGEKENGSGDRQASAKERKLCRKWLDAEIALVRPEVIVPVGSLAVKLFYPPQLQLADVIGESMIDAQGRHIVPLPHPSGASRWLNNPHNVGRLEQALYRLRTLKADLGL
ncbi:MAG: uracil-DNA glycosylase family protein, partial [Anaerolineae bacterium]